MREQDGYGQLEAVVVCLPSNEPGGGTMNDCTGEGRAAGSILVLQAAVRALIKDHPRRAEIIDAAKAARDIAETIMEEAMQSGEVNKTLFTMDVSSGADETLEVLLAD